MDVNEILDLLSSSDDDEDIIDFIEYERRPYVIRPRENHFDEMGEKDFFMRFRLRKATVLRILERIEHEIETPTDRNHSISPLNQVLLTLRFYASGNFLINAADSIKVSKSSACKIIRKVSFAIAQLGPEFIRMPTSEAELLEAKMSFYAKARLPRIIGSVDCTHVKIQSLGGNNAELFRNRKGYFSINVQTIASANLKILDIVARWPGSTHDQIIFDNSFVKRRFENNEFQNCLLVADSGYANSMHVVTPLVRVNNPTEQLYNEAITRTRNPVERQYGVWKRRFPVLAFGLRLKLDTTFAVIIATAILHNIAIDAKEEHPPDDPEVNIDMAAFNEDILVEGQENNYANARDYFLNDYFPHLRENGNVH